MNQEDVQARRSDIIRRLNANAAHVAVFPKSPYFTDFFNALADAGAFNAAHPQRAIPPLDPVLHKVPEPIFAGDDQC